MNVLLLFLLSLAPGDSSLAGTPASGESVPVVPIPACQKPTPPLSLPGQLVRDTRMHASDKLPAPALSTDPLQATAREALAGRWGKLPEWKRRSYQRVIAEGLTVRPGRLWVTHYWPAEGRDGQVDCRGNRCTSRTAACNQLPYGTVVWLQEPCGLRQILDVGARRNDRRARRYGADFWLDRWAPGPRGNYLSHYAVIGGKP